MSRIRILHTTRYQYSEPVKFGRHRLIARPREGHDVQLENQSIDVTPSSQITWARDVFGNSVAWVQPLDVSDVLEFRNVVDVNRREPSSKSPRPDFEPVPLPIHYSAFEVPVVSAYLASVYPEEFQKLGDWARQCFASSNGSDAIQIAIHVGEWIYQNIKYRRREDRGVQTGLQTLDLQSGSCRDMATLMLETVRSLHLPARFASGYLDSASAAAGTAATHAWMEVYFPNHGWFGYDPTISEPASFKHIVTGVSSHPRGVMPVSGTFSCPNNVTTSMTVSVKIENLQNEHANEKKAGDRTE